MQPPISTLLSKGSADRARHEFIRKDCLEGVIALVEGDGDSPQARMCHSDRRARPFFSAERLAGKSDV
jgi:hypothetical protein